MCRVVGICALTCINTCAAGVRCGGPDVPRSRGASGKILDMILISERPAEVADRAVPGHWEGDLIIGLEKSAIGTLVERTSRYTMLLHLPRMEGFGAIPYVKNGSPLAGHGAVAVREAITAQIGTLPEQLRRSLTWDQGGELAQHVQLKIDAGIDVYFCDPHSPWQRPSNENTVSMETARPGLTGQAGAGSSR